VWVIFAGSGLGAADGTDGALGAGALGGRSRPTSRSALDRVHAAAATTTKIERRAVIVGREIIAASG
jgi:hypothetical protein